MKDTFGDVIKPQDRVEFDFQMGIAPLVAAMCEALAIPQTIDRLLPRDRSAALDHGLIVKAFIVDLLTQRSPLLHFAKNMNEFDTQVLFGWGVTPEQFTEARLGRTLDVVSELEDRAVMSELALRGLHIHGAPAELIPIDTTNYSLEGAYSDDIDDHVLQITRGHAKDGRSQAKLVTLGGAVQQDGLPLFGQVLSGNASDAVWFRDAMDEVARFASGTLADNPILVYDAAGSNAATFDLSFDHELPCIIRLSRTFKAAEETVSQAWAADRWEEIGIVATENTSKASHYRTYSCQVPLGKQDWRVLVVHSSALEKQKQATLKRNHPKIHAKLSKAATKLARKGHTTQEQAQEAADAFLSRRTKRQALLSYDVTIEPRTTEKYEKPGRPGPDAQKIQQITYHAVISFDGYDPQRYQEWLQHASCFELASNVPLERCTDREILSQYKQQWKIENVFEFTKTPLVLAPIWLHRPRRVKALLFILWLAVLVATYIRYRFQQSLQQIRAASEARRPTSEETDAVPEDHRSPVHIEAPTLETGPCAGPPRGDWLDQVMNYNSSGTIALAGNRFVTNPTFRAIRDLLKTTTITGFFPEKQTYQRLFHSATRRRLLAYIVCAGFHPLVYLEPYRPTHDLWNYAPT